MIIEVWLLQWKHFNYYANYQKSNYFQKFGLSWFFFNYMNNNSTNNNSDDKNNCNNNNNIQREQLRRQLELETPGRDVCKIRGPNGHLDWVWGRRFFWRASWGIINASSSRHIYRPWGGGMKKEEKAVVVAKLMGKWWWWPKREVGGPGWEGLVVPTEHGCGFERSLAKMMTARWREERHFLSQKFAKVWFFFPQTVWHRLMTGTRNLVGPKGIW